MSFFGDLPGRCAAACNCQFPAAARQLHIDEAKAPEGTLRMGPGSSGASPPGGARLFRLAGPICWRAMRLARD
jgi:hypothetical protein